MVAVIYFSRAGENFVDGKTTNVKEGNTKLLAKKIAEKVKASIYEIEPINLYPDNYSETLKLAEKENSEQLLTPIKSLPIEVKQEKIIFLGFPIWFGSYPMAITSFLESTSLNGKVIYPFCTHEGSGFGSSLEELHKQLPNVKIKKGLPVRGSRVTKSDEAIKNWLCGYFCKGN